ncbi:MAG: hypothetical protein U0441_22040 [Polyangiaceae bacterium]
MQRHYHAAIGRLANAHLRHDFEEGQRPPSHGLKARLPHRDLVGIGHDDHVVVEERKAEDERRQLQDALRVEERKRFVDLIEVRSHRIDAALDVLADEVGIGVELLRLVGRSPEPGAMAPAFRRVITRTRCHGTGLPLDDHPNQVPWDRPSVG